MPIDLQQLDALTQYGATEAEIASHFGVTRAQLRREPGVKEAIKKGAAKRRLLLIQAQAKQALSRGNPSALAEGQRRLEEYLRARAY